MKASNPLVMVQVLLLLALPRRPITSLFRAALDWHVLRRRGGGGAQAYRLLSAEMYAQGWDYPLHLGVTEVLPVVRRQLPVRPGRNYGT